MSQIEIYKEEVLKAVGEFRSAIVAFESEVASFKEVSGNLDDQNSDFVNQMKTMVEHIADKGPKKLIEGLNNYTDEVEKVVNGMREVDEDLANQVINGGNTYPLSGGGNSTGYSSIYYPAGGQNTGLGGGY